MNDRIKALADIATHYANGVCDNDANADWYEVRDTKFAELIVNECISEWVSLTDEEIAQTVGSPLDEVYLNDFRKVMAKLKEKNT